MSVELIERDEVQGRLDVEALCRRAEALLAVFEREEAELSLLITGDEEIHDLNRRFRDKDKPTDVLSFPQEDLPDLPGMPQILGDVIISLDTAARQVAEGPLPRVRAVIGPEYDWRLLDEVSFLLLHGVLHLLGHDHMEPEEAAVMEALEARQLPALIGLEEAAGAGGA